MFFDVNAFLNFLETSNVDVNTFLNSLETSDFGFKKIKNFSKPFSVFWREFRNVMGVVECIVSVVSIVQFLI